MATTLPILPSKRQGKIGWIDADITSNTHFDWYLYKSYLFLEAQTAVAELMATCKDFPLRQKPASFTIEQGSHKLLASAGK